MGKLTDSLWLWGHVAGAHDAQYKLVGTSRMTPAEAAYYMGIPNVIMVRYKGEPKPPWHQYALSLVPLQQVVWSIVGDSGCGTGHDTEEALKLQSVLPNLSGVIMDDFFGRKNADGTPGGLRPAELVEIRRSLRSGPRPLDLWVVLYTHELDLPVQAGLDQCDVVTLWTWHADDLRKLDENFEKLERLAPRHRKVLGLYMWDYGAGRPMPVADMARQCELGLLWLQEGRIEGMIFLASCVCDIELDTVEWVSGWIAEMGEETIS